MYFCKAAWIFGAVVYTSQVGASVTVYSQLPFGEATSTGAAAANYTGAAAYDPTILKAPGIPNPAPGNQFNLQLAASNTSQNGLSIAQSGSFLGFSIEMSVANQVREYCICYIMHNPITDSFSVGINS